MAELFDKSGNPISEVFDVEGNPIDEILTSDEVDKKIEEAQEEAKEDYQKDIDTFKEELNEKEEALKVAEEALAKEQEKDKNFGKLRGTTAEKEKKVEELTEQIKGLTDKITGIETETKRQPVNAMIGKLAGEDEELKKKIKFHYESFAIPEEDTEEKQKERVVNAYTLATGGKPINPLTGEAISSGGGVAPGGEEPGSEGKLSEGGKEVAGKLGIEEKDLKRHKLI